MKVRRYGIVKKVEKKPVMERTAISEYLDTVRIEYEFERNKKVSFENRAGIMLTVYGGLGIILIDKIDLRGIIGKFQIPLDFLVFINIISGISTYFLFAGAIFLLSQIVSVNKYINFEVKQIDEDLISEEKHIGAAKLVLTYKEIILGHRLINEEKARKLKYSIRLVLITLLNLVIYIYTK